MCRMPLLRACYSVFTVLASLTLFVDAETQPCPPFGPPLPLSGPLAGRAAINDATQAVQASIKTALKDGSVFDSNTTSFSIDFYSLQDEKPIFNYHYSAPGLATAEQGVKKVDSDTIYRLGSITKAFTVYTYLASVGDISWNQPVTKYIPELARAGKETLNDRDYDAVRWQDVTLGSLASQLSGIVQSPAPNAEADLVLQSFAGFLPVPHVNGTFCDGSVLAKFPCDRKSFFINLLEQHPIVPAQKTPMYSNLAYQILAYALENMTGTPFPELMKNNVLSPLSMSSTYYPMAPESATANAIIPLNASLSLYFVNLRAYNAGGAVYSTINDLRTFGKSILKSSLLSPALTRRWLQPHSFSPNSDFAVGAPWEIYSVPATSRFPTRLYTKSGSTGYYSTNMILIPDYDVGFTILAAGAKAWDTIISISDILSANFVPAIKQVAATQAKEAYAGTYSSSGDQAPGSNLSLSVTANEGDVGSILRFDSLVSNGTDLLMLYKVILAAGREIELTLDGYPTGLEYRKGDTAVESWRALFNTRDVGKATEVETGPFSSVCGAWANVGQQVYGGAGIDEVLFTKEGGKVTDVEMRFLQEGAWAKSGQEDKRREEQVVRESLKLTKRKAVS